jgi:hypothetical protein
MELIYKKRLNLEEGVVEYKFEDYDYIRLMVFADLHAGNIQCNKKLFKKYLQTALDEPVMVFLNGDMIECGIKSSHGTFDQDMDLNEQIEYVVDSFAPIADEGRLIGVIEGNHEYRMKNHNNLDIAKEYAKDLNVDYFGTAAFIKFILKSPTNHRIRQEYQTYLVHGKSGARQPGGTLNAVLYLRDVALADTYIMSHLHTAMYFYNTMYDTEGMKRVEKTRHYIITPAFLEYWGSYAHRANMPVGGALGVPKLKYHSMFHGISVSMGG